MPASNAPARETDHQRLRRLARETEPEIIQGSALSDETIYRQQERVNDLLRSEEAYGLGYHLNSRFLTIHAALCACGVDWRAATRIVLYAYLGHTEVFRTDTGDLIVGMVRFHAALSQDGVRNDYLHPSYREALADRIIQALTNGTSLPDPGGEYIGSNGLPVRNYSYHDRIAFLERLNFPSASSESEQRQQRAVVFLRGVRSILSHLSPSERRECFAEFREMVRPWPSSTVNPGQWHVYPYAVNPGEYGRETVRLVRDVGGFNRGLILRFCTKWRIQLPCPTCQQTSCSRCPTLYHTQPETLTFHPSRDSEATESDHIIPRYVGLELEVCGLHHPLEGHKVSEAVEAWTGEVKYDGSLPNGGFEIALAPARGDKALEQIRSVCSALESAGGWVDSRAGGHVHVDARDLTAPQIATLLSLWYLLEPAIFAYCAPGRDGNRYCSPWYPRPRTQVQGPISEASGRYPHTLFESFDRDERYKSLNLLNLDGRRKTVEFRLFAGTVTADIAIRNASVAARIVHAAATWSEERLAEVFTYRSTKRLLQEILGDECYQLVSVPDNSPVEVVLVPTEQRYPSDEEDDEPPYDAHDEGDHCGDDDCCYCNPSDESDD